MVKIPLLRKLDRQEWIAVVILMLPFFLAFVHNVIGSVLAVLYAFPWIYAYVAGKARSEAL